MKYTLENIAMRAIRKFPFMRNYTYGFEPDHYFNVGSYDNDEDYIDYFAPVGLHFVYRIFLWPFSLMDWAIDVFKYPSQRFPPLP